MSVIDNHENSTNFWPEVKEFCFQCGVCQLFEANQTVRFEQVKGLSRANVILMLLTYFGRFNAFI